MMKEIHFRLIQRGHVQKDIATPNQIDSLVHWDYMGSYEFEAGALPGSLVRILHNFQQYQLFPTDLFSADGKRVMVFTRNSEIPRKLVDFADRPNPRPYDLQEPSYLEDVRKNNAYANERMPSFWFCIDDSTDKWNFLNGDWMAMFEEDVPAFLHAMEKEKAKWDSYSDEDRQSFISRWVTTLPL
ncbi:MAG: hypothetical protein J6C46_08140 [Clostridia bacterium]|nr:hypothetical protein [Clostridia bacterium]